MNNQKRNSLYGLVEAGFRVLQQRVPNGTKFIILTDRFGRVPFDLPKRMTFEVYGDLIQDSSSRFATTSFPESNNYYRDLSDEKLIFLVNVLAEIISQVEFQEEAELDSMADEAEQRLRNVLTEKGQLS